MRNRNPKSLWDELRSFMGWVDDDEEEGEQAQDPALLFHLLFTVPLVITVLATTRRMLAP
jgi:hypothetical protein